MIEKLHKDRPRNESQILSRPSSPQAPMTGRSGTDGLLGLVTLEKLDGSFVLFGSLSCFEGSEVPPLARPGILLSRVEPILTRLQLSNHRVPPCDCGWDRQAPAWRI